MEVILALIEKMNNGDATLEEIARIERFIDNGINYKIGLGYITGERDDKTVAEYKKMQIFSDALRQRISIDGEG